LKKWTIKSYLGNMLTREIFKNNRMFNKICAVVEFINARYLKLIDSLESEKGNK
jgi:hypothetical protein